MCNGIVRAVGPHIVYHRFYCGKPSVIKDDVAALTAELVAQDKIRHDILESMPAVNVNKTCRAWPTLVHKLAETNLGRFVDASKMISEL